MKENIQENSIEYKTKETPSEYADRLGNYYTLIVTDEHKKSNGQFFTPLKISHFMASFATIDKEKIKILDPGCGIGILSTALIESLVAKSVKVKTIELVVFETDVNILPLAETCFEHLRIWLNNKGINISIFLCKNDFILHNTNILNNHTTINEGYDIVISNPPYFKLPKNDERAIAAKSVIYGQPNIYSIFLLIAAKLLNSGGQLIFITPRSFCSGNYFRLFREQFFSLVDIKEVHLFNSRKSAFKKDKVLQENVIISAKLRENVDNEGKTVTVSRSLGIDDLNDRFTKIYHLQKLIDFNSYQKILHLPASKGDEIVIDTFRSWTGSLNLYNLEISTGPVVDFRSEKMIRFKEVKTAVPLIWLHNIDSMAVKWPLNTYKGKKKGQYIINDHTSFSRLVRNRNYVFLRRFSTKDDSRRLIAAPHFKGEFSEFPMLGIENHLNYIYDKNGELTIHQAFGLAAILNSNLFDLYFRTFNGNINVSATELRDFPLPDFRLIQTLGERLKKKLEIPTTDDIDKLMSEIFNLSIDVTSFYE